MMPTSMVPAEGHTDPAQPRSCLKWQPGLVIACGFHPSAPTLQLFTLYFYFLEGSVEEEAAT